MKRILTKSELVATQQEKLAKSQLSIHSTASEPTALCFKSEKLSSVNTISTVSRKQLSKESFKRLPTELLIRIYQYLNTLDRINLLLVCKGLYTRFHQVEDIWLSLNLSYYGSTTTKMTGVGHFKKLISYSNGNLTSLSIKETPGVSLERWLTLLQESNIKKLKHLKMDKVTIKFQTTTTNNYMKFFKDITVLSNLEVLELYRCNIYDVSLFHILNIALKTLTQLTVEYCNYFVENIHMTEKYKDLWLKTFPSSSSLKSISFYRIKETSANCPSGINALLDVLFVHCRESLNITRFNFCSAVMNVSSIIKILTSLPNLEVLELNSTLLRKTIEPENSRLKEAFIYTFKNLSKLKKLHISYNQAILFSDIYFHLKGLESLDVSYSSFSGLTDDILLFIAQQNGLSLLNISGCQMISTKGFLSCLPNLLLTIQELHLSNTLIQLDKILDYFRDNHCDSLRKLYVNSPIGLSSAALIKFIRLYAHQLVVLDLTLQSCLSLEVIHFCKSTLTHCLFTC